MLSTVRARRVVVVCAMLFCVWAGQAHAQATDQMAAPTSSSLPAFELTPFGGIGDDLGPSGGLAFSIPWTKTISLEAEAAFGTSATRGTVSLMYLFPKMGPIVPYATAGGGVQRREERQFTDDGLFSRNETGLAGNVGWGVVVPVTARWSYRADFRWYNPGNHWPNNWRIYSGVVLGLGR